MIMKQMDVLRLVHGSKLSFLHGGEKVETILHRIETIHTSSDLESFTIKFIDETSQQWVVTDQTDSLECLNMSEPNRRSLPMAPVQESASFAFLDDDVKHSKDDLYLVLIAEFISCGVKPSIIAQAARNIAAKLDGKNDQLELFCWRLYGKHSKTTEIE